MLHLLGGLLGRRDHVDECFEQSVRDEFHSFLLNLAHPAMPAQYKYILLKQCGIPRLNYLCRVLPPRFTEHLTRELDFEVISFFTSSILTGNGAFPLSGSRRQRTLSLKFVNLSG